LKEVEDFAKEDNAVPYHAGIFSVDAGEKMHDIARKNASWGTNVKNKIALVQQGFSGRWPFMNQTQSDACAKYIMDSYVPYQMDLLEHKWPKIKEITVDTALRG